MPCWPSVRSLRSSTDRHRTGLLSHDRERYERQATPHGLHHVFRDHGDLVGFALGGQWVFSLLAISLPAVQVADALVLLRTQRSPVQKTASETAEGATKDDIAITPLAIPMLTGLAAISTVILLEAQAAS